MDLESMNKLRLDRRLVRRRRWIDAATLERELGALPDVSEKAAPAEEPGEAAAATAASPSASPEPVVGDTAPAAPGAPAGPTTEGGAPA